MNGMGSDREKKALDYELQACDALAKKRIWTSSDSRGNVEVYGGGPGRDLGESPFHELTGVQQAQVVI